MLLIMRGADERHGGKLFAAIASHIRSCITGFVRLGGGRVWTHDKSERRAARMRVEDDGNDVRSLLT